MDHLGTDAYLVSSDAAAMAATADSLDYVIDTMPVHHPLAPFLALLKLGGKHVLLGRPPSAGLWRAASRHNRLEVGSGASTKAPAPLVNSGVDTSSSGLAWRGALRMVFCRHLEYG